MRTLEEIRSRRIEIRRLIGTPDADLDALERELDELEVEERDIVAAIERRQETLTRVNGGRPAAGPSPLPGRVLSGDGGDAFTDSTELRSFGNAAELREVGASIAQQRTNLTMADIVRAQCGYGQDLTAEKRTLISSGAGAAIPGASVLGIIEKAIEQSVIFRAGARGVVMDGPQSKLARVVATGSPEFIADTVDGGRDLTDQAFSITAEPLDAFAGWLYTTVSLETVQDAAGLEDAIQAAYSAQLARLYDYVALAATGTDEPLGIANMAAVADGILEHDAEGPLANWSPFVQAAGLVMGQNHDPKSTVMNSEEWTALADLVDLQGQPKQPPAAYAKLGEYVTNVLPAGTAVVGDLSKVIIGTRTEPQIEIVRTGTGFKKGEVEIRAYVRLGMVLADPSAVCKVTVAEEASV